MSGIDGRLRALERRYQELERELSAPEAYQRRRAVQKLSQEQARLREVVETGRAWRAAEEAAGEAEEMRRHESDPEMVALAEEELQLQRAREQAAHERLRTLLLPTDPNDDRDVVVEIRAGTGGDEAALFAGDLFRMYLRYAERRRWSVEVLELQPLGRPRFQGGRSSRSTAAAPTRGSSSSRGVHRVQRVPETESQGRTHTSAASVVVLPEADEVDVADRRQRHQDRRLPEHRARRPERQHHRLGGAPHPPAHRAGGDLPGREVAAQEQGQGAAGAARAALRPRPGRAAARAQRDPPLHGGQRRSQREGAHLQLPAVADHRPPRRPHRPPAAQGAGRRARPARRATGAGRPGQAAPGGDPGGLTRPPILPAVSQPTLVEVVRLSTRLPVGAGQRSSPASTPSCSPPTAWGCVASTSTCSSTAPWGRTSWSRCEPCSAGGPRASRWPTWWASGSSTGGPSGSPPTC